MKNAVLSRHGRLLALCGLSAALHLLVLQLAVRHGMPAPGPAAGGPGPLVLRLAPAPSVPSGAPAPASRPARTAPPSRPKPAPARTASPIPPAAARPAARLPERPSDTLAPAPAAAAGAGGAPSGAELPLQMPARYRVRMPPSVRLVYRLTRSDATGKPGPAQTTLLDWRNDDGRYTLRMDGVLGQVASSGVDSDSGIQPQRFSARRGERQDDIVFDPQGHRIVFADGSDAPDAPGMQDRASLLMQLAGIGLARPGQLQDVIEIAVADAGIARIERFQVLQEEQVDTGVGPVQALHLVQLTAAGEARLDVWLAQDLGWLPVQLRLTEADGTTATQALAATQPAAAP